MNWRGAVLVACLGALIAGPGAAQEEEGEETPAAPTGPETVSGRNEVVGSVTARGLTFELAQGGARLEVPPNLPVGASRRTVFAISRQRPSSADIAEGFRRYGDVLSFDGAIDATRAPVRVSVRARRSPARPDERLVLAMEQAAMCNAQHTQRLPSGAAGLCSSWVLIDARLEGDRLIAELPTPGGFRLVFGTVPVPPEPSAGDSLGGL